MFKVRNGAVISRLARRSIRQNSRRNWITIFAVILTCVMFTTLLTIGMSLQESMQMETMRQVGTRAHGGFKFLTQEQYDTISKDPKIKDISYNIFLALAENEPLKKQLTEIRYAEDKKARWGVNTYPETGRIPLDGEELATSTRVLDALGVPHELGQKVPLEFTVRGQKYYKTFTLCGFWEGDLVAMAQQVWVSRAYVDQVAPLITEPIYDANDISGTVNADVWFSNAWDIEGQMDQLAQRCGFDENVKMGVNWAYTSSSIDMQTIGIILSVLLLILLSGYLIIYNIFYISVARDIRFYGLLKTTGTTSRQLRQIVRRQALWIACAGIPFGLAAGYMIGRLLMPVLLKRTIMQNNMVVSMHPAIFIGAAAFTLLTVYISCIRPCSTAAKVSPVEALHHTGTEGSKQKKKKSRRVSMFSMASANMKRSRKRTCVVVLSLSLSLVLLNSVYTLVNGFSLDKYVEERIVSDFEISSVGIFSYGQKIDTQALTPEFIEQARAFEGVEQFGSVYMNENSHRLSESAYQNMVKLIGQYSSGTPSQYRQESIRRITEEKTAESHIYGVDEYASSKIQPAEGKIDFNQLKTGDYVIASPFRETEKEPYYQVGDKVMLDFGNGKAKEYEVMALAYLPFAMGPQHSHLYAADFILPEDEFLAQYGQQQPMLALFDVEESRVEAMDAWLENYCSKINPELQHIAKADYNNEFKDLQMMFTAVGGILSMILALIGILNFINSMVTSIFARQQEFAILQAVGLTGRQMLGMLVWEGFFYMGWTVFFTVTIGSLAGYGLLAAIASQIDYFTYTFTLLPIACCIPVLAVLTAVIPMLCYHQMCRQSIVERIRAAE